MKTDRTKQSDDCNEERWRVPAKGGCHKFDAVAISRVFSDNASVKGRRA